MERRLRKAIESWLNAERGDDPNRAEAALRTVFLRLPLPAPPRTLIAAVLTRLGLASALAPRQPMRLRWKVAIGSAFALATLAGGTLAPVLASLWTGIGPGKVVDLSAGVLVGLSARVAQGVAVWDAFSGVARAVSASLASPTMVAAIAATALVSAVAFRLLHGLLISERNVRYVESN